MYHLMRVLKNLILGLALCLLGCTGHNWDLDQDITIQVESPELPADLVFTHFSSAITQLGGHAVPGAAQVVHAWYNPTCDCNGCNPNTIAHTDIYVTDSRFDGIQICPRYMLAPEGLKDGVIHETGHVMRMLYHLPKETGAMMTPNYDDRSIHGIFQPIDITSICGSGGVLGGKCGR
jgi:hypothetical protein